MANKTNASLFSRLKINKSYVPENIRSKSLFINIILIPIIMQTIHIWSSV